MIEQALSELGIDRYELSYLIDVHVRTIDRWIKGINEIPLPVEQVLRAWCYMQKNNLPWKKLAEGDNI